MKPDISNFELLPCSICFLIGLQDFAYLLISIGDIVCKFHKCSHLLKSVASSKDGDIVDSVTRKLFLIKGQNVTTANIPLDYLFHNVRLI